MTDRTANEPGRLRMMPVVESAVEPLEGPSLREVLSTVMSGLPIALVVGILLALGAYFGSGLLPKKFEATATVLAAEPAADLTRLGLPYAARPLDLDAYVAIARGDSVRRLAIEQATDPSTFDDVTIEVTSSSSFAARLLSVTATSGSPAAAASAANDLASALVTWDRSRIGRDIASVATLLEQHAAVLRASQEEAIAAQDPGAAAITTELAQRESELSTLRAVAAAPPATLQVVESAVAPDEASAPNVPVNTVLGFAMGFFLSMAFYLVAASLDTRLRSEQAIERVAGLPVVSALPRVGKNQSAYFQAMSYVAAAARSADLADGTGVILVTSVREGAARANASIHLAAAFAADGERTLLVDANTHSPSVGQRLGLERSAGPTTRTYVTANDEDVPDANTVSVGKHAELHVVPSYPQPGGMDLGAKRSLAEWVERWRASFDTIVLDTAPVLLAADALGLARSASAVLVVVTPGTIKAEELRHALDAMQRSGAPLVGIVAAQAETTPLSRLGRASEPKPSPLSLASLGRV